MQLMRHFIWILSMAMIGGAASPALAQNLVPNGDFEDIQRDEFDVPILDAYGYEAPTGWFRSITDPGTEATPQTELISPNNMNNAAGNNAGDDSDGAGTNSIALNYIQDPSNPDAGIGVDWRSEAFDTTPGETLIFSIDVKFIGVSQVEWIPDSGFFEGMWAQVRSFTDVAEDGSTAGTFKDELNVELKAKDFTLDSWNTVVTSMVVPSEGEWTDLRLSTNLFIPGSPLSGGQILIDNLSVIRLTADFDDDNDVDADDLGVWKTNFAVDVNGDADGDGDSDGDDFLAWQRQFGFGVAPPAEIAVNAVPEPAALALTVIAAATLLSAAKRRSAFCRNR
jgi:hypothetical protein